MNIGKGSEEVYEPRQEEHVLFRIFGCPSLLPKPA
jgi:hypothetical protein